MRFVGSNMIVYNEYKIVSNDYYLPDLEDDITRGYFDPATKTIRVEGDWTYTPGMTIRVKPSGGLLQTGLAQRAEYPVLNAVGNIIQLDDGTGQPKAFTVPAHPSGVPITMFPITPSTRTIGKFIKVR